MIELPELPPRLTMSMVVSSNVFKFTEEQMRAYGRVCADAALEAAAMVRESVNNFDNPMTANDCADAIRTLKVNP